VVGGQPAGDARHGTPAAVARLHHVPDKVLVRVEAGLVLAGHGADLDCVRQQVRQLLPIW